MENPKLILEQNMRELNDQVPKMNKTIASVKAEVIRHEKALQKAKDAESALVARIKTALRAKRQDIAREYALQLERIRSEIQQTQAILAQSKQAYEKAAQVKRVFMRERKRKIDEAQHALRAHERAKSQAKVADILEQFEVAGVDQTHDEMISRIDQQTAENEARVEVALDSVDMTALQLEEEAESFHADELLRQFELEMGMGSDGLQESSGTNNPVRNPGTPDRTMGDEGAGSSYSDRGRLRS